MKILLIAYYYPPINSGGTNRPVQMAKYLPQLGHPVTVLTHSYRGDRFDDQSGDQTVIRVKDISYNKDRAQFSRKLQWLGLRLFTEILNKCGIYHSIYSWWKRRVIKHSDRIIREVDPDIVLATYPPVETLELGLYFSRKYNIPLIADFRDGLLFEPIEDKRINQYRCIRDTYRDIERQTLRHARFVTTICSPITRYFRDTYPQTSAVVETISNGFDPDDYRDIPVQDSFSSHNFNILHVGRFSLSDPTISADGFFKALRQLIHEKPHLKNTIRVHLAGELNRAELDSIQDLIQENIVIYYGLVPRGHCLGMQRQADLLLIITRPGRRSAVSAKIFEYLYSRRPIIALTHQTVVEEIVNATQTGWVIHPADVPRIKERLEESVSQFLNHSPAATGSPAWEQFSIKEQLGKLARLLQKEGKNA